MRGGRALARGSTSFSQLPLPEHLRAWIGFCVWKFRNEQQGEIVGGRFWLHLLVFLQKCLDRQIHAKQLLRKLLGESVAGAEREIPNLMGKMKLNIPSNRNPGEFMDVGKLNIHRRHPLQPRPTFPTPQKREELFSVHFPQAWKSLGAKGNEAGKKGILSQFFNYPHPRESTWIHLGWWELSLLGPWMTFPSLSPIPPIP